GLGQAGPLEVVQDDGACGTDEDIHQATGRAGLLGKLDDLTRLRQVALGQFDVITAASGSTGLSQLGSTPPDEEEGEASCRQFERDGSPQATPRAGDNGKGRLARRRARPRGPSRHCCSSAVTRSSHASRQYG